MTTNDPTPDEDRRPDSPAQRVNAACDRFEAVVREGGDPQIEDFMAAAAAADRPELLRELIALEVELRRGRGDRPELRKYRERFPDPDYADLIAHAFDPAASRPEDTGETAPHPPVPDPESILPPAIGRYPVLRILGKGAFGTVYLARDNDLRRNVAIKMPNPGRVACPEDVKAYLREARILAELDHPNIVTVYEVGRTEDDPCFIVSKYIEGSNLADRIKQGRPSFRKSAELVATVAEALHYAHTRGLVHRDIKPANILIDTASEPYVADFGLALRDEDYGTGANLVGTPVYMSPEQARREGHRVNGQSDVFSLGILFYELLTGKRPFRSMELIANRDAEPCRPREIDGTIPRELERIALNALAKNKKDRCTTLDLAGDLRHFLQQTSPTSPSTPPSDSNSLPAKIIPRGLRSFDEHDADFFLELLPGPWDRDRLPESVRFWKRKIELLDPDKTFRVGLIYGPSGCGKSSLVKAGLLPRLAEHVRHVYVESTPEETEVRLLRGLHKVCPDMPADRTLVESLSALRRGRILHPGQKVLLILDQFEQWLFARRGEPNPELITALQQCDGEHVQAVVMVRVDFWMAAIRFMRDLEIPLVEGENSTAVDLFDLLHARRVLTAFGRAYGVLPERTSELTPEQRTFLEQSVAGLAQDGKVISVRLALFAEMVKGKPWTPATLRDVGGTQGVGVTFLEETFSASTAPPKHRLHQKAAQAVLKALLPHSGTDIKGQMRSESELRNASEHADRPRDFGDLIRILDDELRLITPTDPEGSTGEVPSAGTGSERYYQLTHDYLVHSLRDWLTRKQRETRRGRAELRLAERTALWAARPENRTLPSTLEWARIRLLIRPAAWTDLERRMMRRAGRLYGLWMLGLTIATGLAGWGGAEAYGRLQAAALVHSLPAANTTDIPDLINELRSYGRWARGPLSALLSTPKLDGDQRLRASLAGLALLPPDGRRADFVRERLLEAAPVELPVISRLLRTHLQGTDQFLWQRLQDATANPEPRFRAACALADANLAEGRAWDPVAPFVAERLVAGVIKDPGNYPTLVATLRPIAKWLLTPLTSIFMDKGRSETERSLVTNILDEYAKDDPERLAKIQTRFQTELTKEVRHSWNDPPLVPTWAKPDHSLLTKIESAQGVLADRFAFCQAMPLDVSLSLVEDLRKSGYRPSRFRPFRDGRTPKVAAVWVRDGLDWRLRCGLTAEEVRQLDRTNRSEGFLPVNVAGYLTAEGEGVARYAAVWAERVGDDDARVHLETAEMDDEGERRSAKARMATRTLHMVRGPGGRSSHAEVRGKLSRLPIDVASVRDLFQADLEFEIDTRSDQLLMEVCVAAAPRRSPIAQHARDVLHRTEAGGNTGRDQGNTLARARAWMRLGDHRKALEELELQGDMPQSATEEQARLRQEYRLVAKARLGEIEEARDELEIIRKSREFPDRSRLRLAAIVEAEVGGEVDKAFDSLEAALRGRPADSDLKYDAARAYAGASRPIGPKNSKKAQQLAGRAIELLRELLQGGFQNFGRIEDEPDLDPIRDLPAFTEIMEQSHPDRRYVAVWTRDDRFEAVSNRGTDPAAHLQECRKWIDQGYRPASISVTRTAPDVPIITASVWHRPTISEASKDELAERQARAAIALIRMGRAEEIWPLLRHSADPRLRSFIVNWLEPLKAEPKPLIAQLDRLDTAAGETANSSGSSRRPADRIEGDRTMDAILFDPSTSTRRALILSLGTFGTLGLSIAERQSLMSKLFNLYENDPDAGIHAAAEWTLRRWEQGPKLKETLRRWEQTRDSRRRARDF